MQKRKSCTTNMVLQHLRRAVPVRRVDSIFIRAMAVPILGQAAITNIILRVAIWTTSLMIFSVACFMVSRREPDFTDRTAVALAAAFIKAVVLAAALAVFTGVQARQRETIWRHRQILPLRRRRLAVIRSFILCHRMAPVRGSLCRYTFLPE